MCNLFVSPFPRFLKGYVRILKKYQAIYEASYFIKKETLALVLSFVFCKAFKRTYLEEHFRLTGSEQQQQEIVVL